MSSTLEQPRRAALSGTVRAGAKRSLRLYGELTAGMRDVPDFMIIGAKRGGSTSLSYDLRTHSRICPLFPRPDHIPKATTTKGIRYFDQNYARGESWYRSHLPSVFARERQARRSGGAVITGECSPYYLFHPAAAERAAQLLPNAKIIVMLRDPVMRTYSHWKERRRGNAEQLDFRAALAAEDERVGQVEDRLRADPTFRSYPHENFSYARQSEYDTALARWYANYPAERILVLASEDYYADPQQVLDQVLEFLGLPSEPIANRNVRNAAPGEDLDADVRAALTARFEPHNRRLAELTGRTFPWA